MTETTYETSYQQQCSTEYETVCSGGGGGGGGGGSYGGGGGSLSSYGKRKKRDGQHSGSSSASGSYGAPSGGGGFSSGIGSHFSSVTNYITLNQEPPLRPIAVHRVGAPLGTVLPPEEEDLVHPRHPLATEHLPVHLEEGGCRLHIAVLPVQEVEVDSAHLLLHLATDHLELHRHLR